MKLTHSTCQAAYDAEVQSWADTLNMSTDRIVLTREGKVLADGVWCASWK
jgi:hypothetical protein